MPDDLTIDERLTIPGDELEESFSTSGGPGGQHANRSNTRVELRWNIGASRIDEDLKSELLGRLDEGEVSVVVGESRSQFRNRQLARQRLRDEVQEALKPGPPPRRPTRPSRAARQRRLDEKTRRSQVKRQRRKPEIE